MTLAVVRFVNVSHLISAAEAIANECADGSAGWDCCFHHGIDLMAYGRRLRTTTRCLSNYRPNDLETRVERVLAERGIYRGMHEN